MSELSSVLSDEEIEQFMQLKKKIAELLHYDTEIYDSYSIKRQIIKSKIKKNIEKYHQLTVPYIDYCDDDLESEDEIIVIENEGMPPEFWVIFYGYLTSPSITVKIYSPNFIQSIIAKYTKHFNHAILEENDEIFDHWMYIPIIYTKSKLNVNTLCLAHSINEEITNKFCVIKVVSNDIVSDYLIKIFLENKREQMMDFPSAYNILLSDNYDE